MIKMTDKGRSTAMRHVSRTHRGHLDWLYERFLHDLHFQIKYMKTKFQIADTLAKGSFTIDQWKGLLRLCCITMPKEKKSCKNELKENEMYIRKKRILVGVNKYNEEENKISNTDNTSKIKSQLHLKTIEDLNFD